MGVIAQRINSKIKGYLWATGQLFVIYHRLLAGLFSFSKSVFTSHEFPQVQATLLSFLHGERARFTNQHQLNLVMEPDYLMR
jgi:hypothetical protein